MVDAVVPAVTGSIVVVMLAMVVGSMVDAVVPAVTCSVEVVVFVF